MAPEQARGEVDRRRRAGRRLRAWARSSARSSPASRPSPGRSRGEILRKAARGDTADALARLDACGADAELVALARDCLAAEPEDRPRDAGVVAERITAYLAGVQERLAGGRARAGRGRGAGRSRSGSGGRLQLGLAGLGAGADDRSAAWRRPTTSSSGRPAPRAVDRLLARGRRRCATRPAQQPEDVGAVARRRWRRLRRPRPRSAAGGDPSAPASSRPCAPRSQAGLRGRRARPGAARRGWSTSAAAKADDPDGSATDAAYADAFREAGSTSTPCRRPRPGRGSRPGRAAGGGRRWPRRWTTGRPCAAATGRRTGRLATAAGGGPRRRPRPLPRPASAPPWSSDRQGGRGGRAAGRWPPTPRRPSCRRPALVLLGRRPGRCRRPGGGRGRARAAAVGRHPDDVWVNYDLAGALDELRPAARDEAIRYYTAARALRPETAHELAHLLERHGPGRRGDRGLRATWSPAGPTNAQAPGLLRRLPEGPGPAARRRPVLDRAVAADREAIRLKPDDAEAHINLGIALHDQGKLRRGRSPHYREAIRLKPDYAEAHDNLGIALARPGEARTRRSPTTARRSGSSPTSPRPTTTSATP